MFILYAADLDDVATKHSVNIHTYPDDTQLYLHGHRDDTTSTVHRVKSCVTDVGQWMSAKRLKLNTDKTELLWAWLRHSQSSLTSCGPSLQLGADTITAQNDVCLLGVTISSDLVLQRHVSNVSATSFYWLRQLRHVQRSLDSESAATLVHAFATSRVDQCNVVLAGATKSVTGTLQRVMNAAARVVNETSKFDHGLTQILHDDIHSMWQIEYFISLVSSCTDVGMASPMLLTGSVSGRPHSNWWWCHDIGYPLLAAKHSLCTAPWSGTPCRMTSALSRTMSPQTEPENMAFL